MDNIRNNLYRNLGRDLVCCENERIKDRDAKHTEF